MTIHKVSSEGVRLFEVLVRGYHHGPSPLNLKLKNRPPVLDQTVITPVERRLMEKLVELRNKALMAKRSDNDIDVLLLQLGAGIGGIFQTFAPASALLTAALDQILRLRSNLFTPNAALSSKDWSSEVSQAVMASYSRKNQQGSPRHSQSTLQPDRAVRLKSNSNMEALDEAKRLHEERKYGAVVRKTTEIIRTTGDKFPVAHYLRAYSYMKLGKPELAIADLKKVIPHADNIFKETGCEIYSMVGEAYRLVNQLDAALDYNSKVIERKPNDTSLLEERVRIYCTMGKLDLALQDCDEIIRLEPENPWSYCVRAQTHKFRDLQAALVDSGIAIQFGPDYVPAYLLRASIYREQKNYEACIEDASKAIVLDPKDPEGYLLRGTAYANRKQNDLALLDLSDCLRLDPRRAEARFARGSIWYIEGDFDRAIDDLSQALKFQPNDLDGFMMRALAYTHKELHSNAIHDFDKVLKAGPNNLECLVRRGIAHGCVGNLDHSIQDLRRAIELDPKNVRAHRSSALAFATKGDYASAIRHWTLALEHIETDPTFKSKTDLLLIERGISYMEQKDDERAIQDFTKAIEAGSSRAGAWGCRAAIYVGRRKYDLAIADLSKAIERDPINADWIRDRAKVYTQCNQDELALRDLNSVIGLDGHNPDDFESRAQLFEKKRLIGPAINDWSMVALLQPSNPLPLYRRALLRNDKDEALNDLNRALKIDRKFPDAYLQRALISLFRGEAPAAIVDFNQVIALSPNNAAAYEGRAEAYRKRGNKDDSARALQDEAAARQLGGA